MLDVAAGSSAQWWSAETFRVPSADYGSYARRRVREAGDQEALRFEATLTCPGRGVAVVSNGGEGARCLSDQAPRRRLTGMTYARVGLCPG